MAPPVCTKLSIYWDIKVYTIIPDLEKISDSELINLFQKNDSRQLIHITYGSILRAKDNKGKYIFKDRIYKVLFQYEEDHYRELSNHIKRHLKLLVSI